MLVRKMLLCLVQCLLLLLCLVPLACALGMESPLPDNTCPPAGVSSAAPAPSIDDVWMKNGGARLYYSALYGARQQYTGGATRIDPACSPLLPPLRAWGTPAPKKYVKARKSATAVAKPAASPCPDVDKAVEAAKAETRAKVEAELKADGKAAAAAKANAADAVRATTVQKTAKP